GNLDVAQRERLLRRLSARWTADEERHYTSPSLDPVLQRSAAGSEARTLLLANSPDFPERSITVLYGPGGIGKTFFLRRVTHRLTSATLADPCLGIPVFAELPVLLHADSLETWLSNQGI